MSHANAALTPRARLRVARLVVEEGWPVSEVAARFQCSWPTVKRRVDRYRAGRPMTDRSSRPRSCPHRTPKAVVKRVVSLRMHLREGPVQRAVSWFSARGGTVERVLSDNGAAYRSQAWKAACRQLGIKAKRTRPYRPQTNGKIERFHRTLSDGWATPATTTPRPNAAKPYPHGCTSTITTDPTPPPKTTHPSPAQPTSPISTLKPSSG